VRHGIPRRIRATCVSDIRHWWHRHLARMADHVRKSGCGTISPSISSRIQPNPIQSNPIQSNPIQSSPIQSNPVQCNPIQSNPIQSNPIQSNPSPIYIQSSPITYNLIPDDPVQSILSNFGDWTAPVKENVGLQSKVGFSPDQESTRLWALARL
jgi:hypothetical protein